MEVVIIGGHGLVGWTRGGSDSGLRFGFFLSTYFEKLKNLIYEGK